LLFIYLLKKSRDLGSLACRLTQWTGKSRYPIHPKHLVQIEPPWYLEGIQAGDRVLALGCGNGQHVFKAAQKAKEVVGLDKDEKQLAIAQSLAEEKEVGKVKFLRADLEKGIKFKDNSFDKILALDVLEHLENRNQFLKEVKRLVKPGGLIFLAIPNRNTSWKKRQKRAGLNSYTDPDHKIEYSLGEIKKLLKEVINK